MVIALGAGRLITCREGSHRYPAVSLAGLETLRQDIIDATFVVLLHNKGHILPARTREEALRGWEHLHTATDEVTGVG